MFMKTRYCFLTALTVVVSLSFFGRGPGRRLVLVIGNGDTARADTDYADTARINGR
jgi:hypothetical protein